MEKIKLTGTDQEKASQMVNMAKSRLIKCEDFSGLEYSKNFIIEYAKCVKEVCAETGKFGTKCADTISKNIETFVESIKKVKLTEQERIYYAQIIDNANKRIFQICMGGYALLGLALLSLVYLILKLLTKK